MTITIPTTMETTRQQGKKDEQEANPDASPFTVVRSSISISNHVTL